MLSVVVFVILLCNHYPSQVLSPRCKYNFATTEHQLSIVPCISITILFFLYEWECFRILKLLGSCCICCFVIGLFLTKCLEVLFTLNPVSQFSSTPTHAALNTVACIRASFNTIGVASYVHATFCLSVHLSINTSIMSIFWIFKIMLLWFWWTNRQT